MLRTGDYAPRLEMMASPERYFTDRVRTFAKEKFSKLRAPVLILHSDRHDLRKLNRPLVVPVMKEAGVDVQYREYPGFGHGFYFGGGGDRWGKAADLAVVEAVVRDVREFLDRKLAD
jgi:acetyl esterase/lipase